jgi:hypothetical protein
VCGLQQLAGRRERETAIVVLHEDTRRDEKSQHAQQHRTINLQAFREIVRGSRTQRQMIRNAELRHHVDRLRAQRAADEMAHRRLRCGIEPGQQFLSRGVSRGAPRGGHSSLQF